MTTARPTPLHALEDAELARAAVCGNQSAFAAIYDRYADRLHDFCVGMLRDRDAAADCVQDVFVTAATRLAQLREPDRLRSWLYAIARNEALARIRERRREQPSEYLPEMPSGEPDSATLAARNELADLISEACGGLSDRDRAVYELAYRQGLDGPELAAALGVSHTNANTLVGRMRDNIERSLGALLVCRRAKADPDGGCPELAALLDHWDGRFTVLMRKRVARHIEGCAVCEQNRSRMVNPVALLGSAPVFLPAPAWLRAQTLTRAPGVATQPGSPAGPGGGQVGPGSAGASGSASSGGAAPSWWPQPVIDTTDLSATGPGSSTPPGTPPVPPLPPHPAGPKAPPEPLGPTTFGPESPTTSPPGPSTQPPAGPGSPQVSHVNSGPTAPAHSLPVDSATGHLGGHIRIALLVALLLLVLGGSFLLGPPLIDRVWPTSAPGGPVPATAPAQTPATTTPAGSPPTGQTPPPQPPRTTPPTETPATTTPAGSPPTGQTPPPQPPRTTPPTETPATTTPTGSPPTGQTPPPQPPRTTAPGAQTPTMAAPAAQTPNSTAPATPGPNAPGGGGSAGSPAPPAPGASPIPRQTRLGGSNGSTCPQNTTCSPTNGIR